MRDPKGPGRGRRAAAAVAVAVAAAAALAAAAARPATAATYAWKGGGSGNAWNAPGNWVGNVAPPSDLLNTDVLYGATPTLFPSIQPAYAIRSLTFNAASSAYTFDTGPLTVGAGGVTQAGTSAQAFGNPVVLGAAQTWAMSAGGPVVVGGGLNTAGYTLTLSAPAAATAALSGPITGTGSLVKAGAGTVTLNGASTYAGTTAVRGGTLGSANAVLAVDGPAGTTATVGGNADGTGAAVSASDLYVGNQATGSVAQAGGTVAATVLYVGNGPASRGAYAVAAGQLNVGGIVVGQTAGATGTVDQTGGTVTATSYGIQLGTQGGNATATYNLSGGTLACGGIFAGYGSTGTTTLNLNGGTLRATGGDVVLSSGLTAANVLAGGVTVDVSSAYWADYATAFDPLLHGGPAASADGGLTKVGDGLLDLYAADTYAGPTTVAAGTLVVANPAAVRYSTVTVPPAGGSVAFDARLSSNASTPAVTFGGLAGSGTIRLQTNAAAPAPVTLSVGGNNASTAYAGALTGPGSLTKVGTGTLTLTGPLTYAGQTTVAGGTLAVGPGGSVVTPNGSFQVDGPPGTAATVAGNADGTGGAVACPTVYAGLTNAGRVTQSGGTVTVTTNGLAIALQPSATGAYTLGGGVLNTTGAVLGRSGTLNLDGGVAVASFVVGTSTAPGTLNLNGGTLRLTAAAAAVPGSGVTVSGVAADVRDGGAVIDTAGGNATFGVPLAHSPSGTLAGAGVVFFGGSGYASAPAVTVTGGGGYGAVATAAVANGRVVAVTVAGGQNYTAIPTLTFSGGGGGSGAAAVDPFTPDAAVDGGLTKLGAGTLTLAGANTYTGGTTVVGGTLELPAAATITGPLTTAATGSALFDAATTGGVLNRSLGAVTVAGRGSVTLAPAAASANRTLLTAASVTVTGAGRLDVGDNDLRLTNTTAAAVTALVASGQLTSGTAASDPRHLTAVGVVGNGQGGGSLYSAATPFDGTAPAAADVLARFTFYGDANLDGVVDGRDYTRLDAGYAGQSAASPATGWFNGDFNYDGRVDGSDYTLADNASNLQRAGLPTASVAGPLPSAVATPTAEPAAVPEPAGSGAAAAALSLLARRRRRRR